ncbi:MAG: hypothetical protein AAF213_08665 [Pseudomonadota bacterium]
MAPKLRAPSLEDINPGDPTVEDLFAAPVDPSQLNFWRGKRFVSQMGQFLQNGFPQGSSLMSIDVHEAGLAVHVRDPEGVPAVMPIYQPNVVTEIDPETGLGDMGAQLYTVVPENGFGAVYNTQDQSERPRVFDSFSTALETVVMGRETSHVRQAIGIATAQLAEDKFDRIAAARKTMPMPGLYQ